jgi:hypothetical protein
VRTLHSLKLEHSVEGLPVDTQWETRVTLRLRINPQLQSGQRDALRMDYGLLGDILELEVREAMKPYVLANLYLEEGYRELPRHFVSEPSPSPPQEMDSLRAE